MGEWKESNVQLTQRDLLEQSSAGGDAVAFLMIRSKLGKAQDLAIEVSSIEGVRWAAELISSPYDVVAAVRVGPFDDLEAVVTEIEQLDAIKNPTVAKVVGDPYVGGERVQQGWP